MMARRTSNRCHLCDAVSTEVKQTFVCEHVLCGSCMSVAGDRSVCPTCSPETDPQSPYIFKRMFSIYDEASKTINNGIRPTPSPSSDLHPSLCSTAHRSASTTRSGPTSPRVSPEGGRRHAAACSNDAGPPSRRPVAAGVSEPHQLLRNYGRSLRGLAVSVTEKLHHIRSELKKSELSFSTTEREIKSMASEWRNAIDRAERKLMRKLNAYREDQRSEAVAIEQDMKELISQLESQAKSLEDAVEDCSSQDTVDCHGLLSDAHRILEARTGTMLFRIASFCPESLPNESKANIVGEVEFPPEKETCEDHSRFLSSPVLLHSFENPHLPNDQQMSMDDLHHHQSVIGLTLVERQIFIIRTRSHEIEVYDVCDFAPQCPRLSLLHFVEGMRVPCPTELVSCPKTCSLYLADSSNSFVYRIQTDGKLLRHWKCPNVIGMSVTEVGTVLVCSPGGIIDEFDQNGGRLRRLKRHRIVGGVATDPRKWKPVVEMPRHILRSHFREGLAVVCDWTNNQHAVYDMNESGHVTNWLPKDDELAKLNEPSHLAVTSTGHVLVADRMNDRVVLLDSRLRFLRELVGRSHGLSRPNRLHLDPDSGILYIGETNGRTSVFKILAS